MKNLELQTSSVFEEASKRFKTSSLSKRLAGKYTIKPFFEKYKNLRLTVFLSSFFLNAFSAATAASFVFCFVSGLLSSFHFSLLLTVVFLILLESLKRFVIPSFFKDAYQFGLKQVSFVKLIFIFGLSAASVTLSYQGAKQAVSDLTPSAKTIDIDALQKPFLDKVEKYEAKQKDIKKSQSWKGTLTKAGQKSFHEVELLIGQQERERLQAVKEAEAENKASLSSHKQTTSVQVESFALVTLGLDLLLVLAFLFLENYDFKSFTEFARLATADDKPDSVDSGLDNVDNADQSTLTNSVATDNNARKTDEVLVLAMKKAKANISAYQSKINNGQGKPETNQQGLRRWLEKLKQLQSLKGLQAASE